MRGLILLLASAAAFGTEPVREWMTGSDVGWCGKNAYSECDQAALIVDTTGLVTVRVGQEFPLLKDDSGAYVRIRRVRVIR